MNFGKKCYSVGAIAAAFCGAAALPQSASAQPAITLTAVSGARQTFGGLGTSLGNWGGPYQTLTRPQQLQLSKMLWRDLNFKILKVWFNFDDYSMKRGEKNLTPMLQQYVNSKIIADAKANGVTTLFCAPDHFPPYMVAPGGNNWKGPIIDSEVENFAALVATGIKHFKDETGISFDATGIQNEPDLTAQQVARMTKALRLELDKRGLQSVKVVTPESSSVDDRAYGMLDAVKADPAAWKAAAGIATHSYNMAATDRAASYAAAPDGTNLKEYWMTEASDNGTEDPATTGVPAIRGASLSARFLNDMNHRVTHWIHFLGFETTGNGSDDATRIIPFNVQPFRYEILRKYYYYQQLAQAFDVGAVFRDTQSSLDGDMTYTFGRKPHLIAATARNADGTWSVGIQNFTANSFSGWQGGGDEWNRTQGGRTPATPFKVTVKISELSSLRDQKFTVHRTNDTLTNAEDGTVTMNNGQATITVAPLELVTLRSVPIVEPAPTPDTTVIPEPTPDEISADVPAEIVHNKPPTVRLTTPSNSATFAAGKNIQLTAKVADSDGEVAKVEFYQGRRMLGRDTTAPYTFLWKNVKKGVYSVTAKATDNDRGTKNSAAVRITVKQATKRRR